LSGGRTAHTALLQLQIENNGHFWIKGIFRGFNGTGVSGGLVYGVIPDPSSTFIFLLCFFHVPVNHFSLASLPVLVFYRNYSFGGYGTTSNHLSPTTTSAA
jgi:hypothetical protein